MEYKLLGIKFRVEILIIGVVIGMIMGGHLLCSCSKISLQEGFEIGNDMINVLTDKLENGSKKKIISNNDSSVIIPAEMSDLDSGILSMDFFEETNFKPEACPNTYSSSTGCATFGPKQKLALATRGGNNTAQSLI